MYVINKLGLTRQAQDIVRLLLYHGQMRAGDVIDTLACTSGTPSHAFGDLSTSQHAGLDAQRAVEIRALLVRMLQESLVRPSTPIQHVSPQDRQLALELMLRKSQKGIPTTKSLREIKGKVASIINEEDRRDWEGATDNADDLRLGLIHKPTSDPSRDKRAKRRSNTDVSAARDTVDIDPEVWLRVHYDFFHIRMRNTIITRAVSNKYNAVTGDVMRYMLDADRPGIAPCERDERSRPISVTALAHRIPSDARIQRGLDRRSIMGHNESSNKTSTPSTSELVAEYVAILSCNDSISSTVRRTRFLAPCSSGTMTSAGGGTRVSTTFSVEYVNIVEQIQLRMIRDVVVERFGSMAGRIFTILVEKGKLEEKHISKVGLISMSETRDICSRLFAASILSLQEVPKSNERNPQRTFFLWFVDVLKCKSWLLDQLYKTLVQLSRRRLYEQSQRTLLLQKSERTDVREDAVGLLTDWERKELASLQSVQEAITVAETRVVRDVFLLQHFST